jgi:hypothetical protein
MQADRRRNACEVPPLKTGAWFFAAMVLTILLAPPFTATRATAQGSDPAAKILALENK